MMFNAASWLIESQAQLARTRCRPGLWLVRGETGAGQISLISLVLPSCHVDDMSLYQTWELENSVLTPSKGALPRYAKVWDQKDKDISETYFIHTTRFYRVIAGISRDCTCQTIWEVSWPMMGTVYFENGLRNGQQQRYAMGWKSFLPKPPNLLRSGQAPAWVWYSTVVYLTAEMDWIIMRCQRSLSYPMLRLRQKDISA